MSSVIHNALFKIGDLVRLDYEDIAYRVDAASKDEWQVREGALIARKIVNESVFESLGYNRTNVRKFKREDFGYIRLDSSKPIESSADK